MGPIRRTFELNELVENIGKILKIKELHDQYTGVSDPEYEEFRKGDPEDIGGVVDTLAEAGSAGTIIDFRGSSNDRIYFFSDGSVRTKKVKEFNYIDRKGFVNVVPIVLGQVGMAIVGVKPHPKTAYQETRFIILAPFRLMYNEEEYKQVLSGYGADYDPNCVFKSASILLGNLGYNTHRIRLDLIDNTVGTDKDKIPPQTGSGDCIYYDLSNAEVTLEKLRAISSRKAKYRMNRLEWEGITNFLNLYLSKDPLLPKYSLAKDGTLFDIIKSRPSNKKYLRYIVGISKSFSLRPIYEIREKYKVPMMKILQNLEEGQRTRAFILDIDNDFVVFWYMRLRKPVGRNAQLVSIGDRFNGLIKVEIYFPEAKIERVRKNKPITRLYNVISAKIYNSRFPIPYRDRRWLSSLYPTFLCEEVIKSAFLSNFSLAQILENIFRRL